MTAYALIACLGRKEHPNGVLVGEEGVGRRSVIHGLAHAIATGDTDAFTKRA